jgi:hypothetical protein
MTKYRFIQCLNETVHPLARGAWGYQPIDMRKKYFRCVNCHELHLVKYGVKDDTLHKPIKLKSGET